MFKKVLLSPLLLFFTSVFAQKPCSSGRQFAPVVNGKILYTGYFWNIFSSFGCNGITAFAWSTQIEVLRKLPDYDAVDSTDPRQHEMLIDCFKKRGVNK